MERRDKDGISLSSYLRIICGRDTLPAALLSHSFNILLIFVIIT